MSKFLYGDFTVGIADDGRRFGVVEKVFEFARGVGEIQPMKDESATQTGELQTQCFG